MASTQLTPEQFKWCESFARAAARRAGCDWREVLGAAWEGFARAERTYDPAKGAAFSSHVYHCCQSTIADYFRHRLPAGVRRNTRGANAAKANGTPAPKAVELGFATDWCDPIGALEVKLDLESLPARLRFIATHLCLGYTQAEVANRLGVSDSYVCLLRQQIQGYLRRRGYAWRK